MKQSQLKDIATDLLMEHNKLRLRAKGCSMLPLFKEGDEFILEKVTGYNFKIGEILVYSKENEFVIHRVQKYLPNDEMLLWGDFNRNPDLPIKKALIQARATHFIRNGKTRRLNSFWLTLFGKFITLFSPLSHRVIFYLVIFLQKVNKILSQKRV